MRKYILPAFVLLLLIPLINSEQSSPQFIILESLPDEIEQVQEVFIESHTSSSRSISRSTPPITIIHRYTHLPIIFAQLTPEAISTLKQDPTVKAIAPPINYQIQTSVGSPSIGATQVREELNFTGYNITVAIVDTGLDYTHPDLGNCTAINASCRTIGGHDYINDDDDPQDDHGHGSHVAGTIGANGTFQGVAPEVSFLAYKSCNAAGSCPTADILSAVDAAIDNNTNVLSLSLGGEAEPNNGQSALSLALESAVEQGVTVVVAAGNNGPSTGCVTSPADALSVITVGASDDDETTTISDDTIASFSCSGPSAFGRFDPDLIAPGVSIYSTSSSNGYATRSGTSMATPHVAGAAALLLQFNSSLTPAQVRARLMHTAADIKAHPFEQGAGIINISRAINTTLFIENDDRLEHLAHKAARSPHTLTIQNDYSFPLTFTLTATPFTDLEGAFSLAASIFSFPTPYEIPANSNLSTQFNLTIPSDANASIYAATINITSNQSHTLRYPIALTVIEDSPTTIQAVVDRERSTCSNTPCGDKIFYLLNTTATNTTTTLSWIDENNDFTLRLYNTSGTQLQSTTSGTTNQTLNTNQTLFWTMLHITDLVNNGNDLSYNLTITQPTSTPSIIVHQPTDNSYTNTLVTLNLTLEDNDTLSFFSYTLYNESQTILETYQNTSIDVLSFNFTQLINLTNATFHDNNLTLQIITNDTLSNFAEQNSTLTLDTTSPLLFNTTHSPQLTYNTNTLVFLTNATDLNLNTTLIAINSSVNFTNYTTLNSGNTYNYTFNETLTNNQTIFYYFTAIDLASNINTSQIFNLTIQNRPLTSLNITNPLNNSVLELASETQFNATANDPDSDTLTYQWDFGDNTSNSSQNPLKFFTQTGTFHVQLNVTELTSSNTTNITLTINDTLPPTIEFTYDATHHISEQSNQTITATLTDYSHINATSLELNNELLNESCTQSSIQWNCSWLITNSNLSIGTSTLTLNTTDNFTVQHTNSTNYTLNVYSCSDGAQNGAETGTDCGGSCAACPSSSSSSSGGSGGGGGGGGGILSSQDEESADSDSSSSSSGSSGGGATSSGSSSSDPQEPQTNQANDQNQDNAANQIKVKPAKPQSNIFGAAIGTIKEQFTGPRGVITGIILLILSSAILFVVARKRAIAPPQS